MIANKLSSLFIYYLLEESILPWYIGPIAFFLLSSDDEIIPYLSPMARVFGP